MARSKNDEIPERARRAMASIHEAREAADQAVDEYIVTFYNTDDGDDRRRQAHVNMHKAVIMFYNRLRAYIYEKGLEHEVLKESPNGQKVFYLKTLEKWRTPTRSKAEIVEVLGENPRERVEERQLCLPPELCYKTYDKLNEIIVKLDFGAQLNQDVDETSVEDALDDEEEEDEGADGSDDDDGGDDDGDDGDDDRPLDEQVSEFVTEPDDEDSEEAEVAA